MTIPSDFNQDVQDWINAQNQADAIDAEYKTEISSLMSQIKEYEDWIKGGKKGPEQGMPPAQALWVFQTEVAPLISQSSEYKIEQEADALNVSNDLRNAITSSQNAFNQIITDLNNKTTPSSSDVTSLLDSLQALSGMINDQGAQNIFGPGTVTSMNGFIASVTNIVGNPTSLQNFFTNYQNALNSGDPVPPEVNMISTAFNNLNQSVSGMSTTTQTQMQYLQQNLQQFFAIYKSIFDDYSNLNSYIISKT